MMKSKNADIRGTRLRSGCVSRRQLRDSANSGLVHRSKQNNYSLSPVGASIRVTDR